MGYEVVPVQSPAEAREVVEVVGVGTEAAARIKTQRCARCAEPIGLNRPFRSLSGGSYRHIDCASFEGA